VHPHLAHRLRLVEALHPAVEHEREDLAVGRRLPSSSLQMKTVVSAKGPLVMNVLEPFSRYSSPSRRAVACILPNASEPESGSVIAQAPTFSKVRRIERPAPLLGDRAAAHDRPRRQAHAHAHGGHQARRAPAQLDDRQEHEAGRGLARRRLPLPAAVAALGRAVVGGPFPARSDP